jgi:hypothetical protein
LRLIDEIKVVKWDGQSEPNNREKVSATLIKYGLAVADVVRVLNEIDEELYDGIPTKEVYNLRARICFQNQTQQVLFTDEKRTISRIKLHARIVYLVNTWQSLVW